MILTYEKVLRYFKEFLTEHINDIQNHETTIMSSFKNIVKNIKNDYLYNLINIYYLSKDENYHNKLKNIVLNIRKIQTSKFNFLIKDVNIKFYHENIDNFQNKEKTKKFIRNNLDIIKIDFIRIISNGYMGFIKTDIEVFLDFFPKNFLLIKYNFDIIIDSMKKNNFDLVGDSMEIIKNYLMEKYRNEGN